MNFTSYILPCAVVFIVCFGLWKKASVFDVFTGGAKEGAVTAFKILPSLVGLMVAVSMLRASGALDAVAWLIKPVLRYTGLPAELVPLVLLRPVSGGGSLALLESTLQAYGADSMLGRMAAVLQGSTETTFYALTVYYGSVGIKKTRHTLGAALTGDAAGFIFSVLAVRLVFSIWL